MLKLSSILRCKISGSDLPGICSNFEDLRTFYNQDPVLEDSWTLRLVSATSSRRTYDLGQCPNMQLHSYTLTDTLAAKTPTSMFTCTLNTEGHTPSVFPFSVGTPPPTELPQSRILSRIWRKYRSNASSPAYESCGARRYSANC